MTPAGLLNGVHVRLNFRRREAAQAGIPWLVEGV